MARMWRWRSKWVTTKRNKSNNDQKLVDSGWHWSGSVCNANTQWEYRNTELWYSVSSVVCIAVGTCVFHKSSTLQRHSRLCVAFKWHAFRIIPVKRNTRLDYFNGISLVLVVVPIGRLFSLCYFDGWFSDCIRFGIFMRIPKSKYH